MTLLVNIDGTGGVGGPGRAEREGVGEPRTGFPSTLSRTRCPDWSPC